MRVLGNCAVRFRIDEREIKRKKKKHVGRLEVPAFEMGTVSVFQLYHISNTRSFKVHFAQ